MFVSSAFADGAKTGLSGFDWMSIAPIALIFVVFYFLILRPQQQKNKKHQDMLQSLKRGERVITSSGLIGSIDRFLNESEVVLEIADGVKVRLLRSSIHDLYAPQSQPHAITSAAPAQPTEQTPSRAAPRSVSAPAKKKTVSPRPATKTTTSSTKKESV